MSKKATDILAYFGPVGLIISFIFAKNKNASRLALNQGLSLTIITILCSVIDGILGNLSIIHSLVSIIHLAIFIFSIWGLVNAIKGEDKPLPVIGNIKLL